MDPTSQSPQTPKSISLGALAGFLAVGLVLLLLFLFGTEALRNFVTKEEDYEAKRSVQRVEIRDKVLAQADADLNRYAWKNQDKGVVQLPIQRAMELTVASLQQNNEIKPANFIDPLKAAAEQQPAAAPVSEPATAEEAQIPATDAAAPASADPADPSTPPAP